MMILAGLLSTVAAGAALAQGFTVVDEVVDVRLLPGWRTERGTHMTALRVDLAPGWKTYWRAPGDGGIPPVFDWAGSGNIGSVALHWPTPTLFEQLGYRSIGYRDRLVLPIEVSPQRPGQPIRMDGTVQIGVCEEICIPVTLAARADLMPGDRGRDPVIAAALADRPATAAEAGVSRVTCDVAPIADGLQVTARIDAPATGAPESVAFEAPIPDLWVSEADVVREGRSLTARADFVPPEGAPFLLDRSTLRLTLVGQNGAIEMQGCTAP